MYKLAVNPVTNPNPFCSQSRDSNNNTKQNNSNLNYTLYILFFFSPDTTVMSIDFATDVKNRLVTKKNMSPLNCHFGRAIAQAVSRWLPTSAARVQTRVQSCGICGGQSGAGAGFLRVLRFLPPIFILPISPPSPIIRGWYNRPVVAAVPKVPPRK
jgi:hypothetical protein